MKALARLVEARRRKQSNTKWAAGLGIATGVALLAIDFVFGGLTSIVIAVAGGVAVFTSQESAIDEAQRDFDEAESRLRELERETDAVRALTAGTARSTLSDTMPLIARAALPDDDEGL